MFPSCEITKNIKHITDKNETIEYLIILKFSINESYPKSIPTNNENNNPQYLFNFLFKNEIQNNINCNY